MKGVVEKVSEDKVLLFAGSFRMEVPIGRLKKPANPRTRFGRGSP